MRLSAAKPISHFKAHAAEILAGLHHVLEDGLALAERGIRIDAFATGQHQGGEQRHAYNFQRHDRETLGLGKSARDYPPPTGQEKPWMMSGFYRAGSQSPPRVWQSMRACSWSVTS